MRITGLLLVFFLVTVASSAALDAFADPLYGATKQRLGNYDLEMTTEPKGPVAGETSKIMFRVAGVNGDDLVDVPIVVRILKDGAELHRTNPIIVPYGHHTLDYSFIEPGGYALYIDLKDYAYSGETLTFTFPIKVAGPMDYIFGVLPIVLGIAAAAIGALVVIKKRQKLAMN